MNGSLQPNPFISKSPYGLDVLYPDRFHVLGATAVDVSVLLPYSHEWVMPPALRVDRHHIGL